MYLADEAWPDLRSYFESESLALVPLGSTEQHGPHLPESTDHVIAESLAREAAARTGYLCTPTVNVGVSPHHRQFPGTMWVSPDAFREYVADLTRNLTYHGIDRVVYVNAHGGNVEHLREVGRQLHAEETCYAIEWMWDESIPDLVEELFDQPGPHGGPKETAMLMHLTDLVHDDRLTDARDGGCVDIESDTTLRVNGARTFYDARENSENGVFGDQTDASPEAGERLFEAAVDQLCQLCEWLAARDPAELRPKPRV
ncbi:creatininase family protein [Halorarius halobius]|uniref:creatininase family protein n=1 Tax=Halorarius halobius TaxID=2962671 RepID=UPI0020CBCD21|nr:creatininase family protein [Halorarius halobius]